ncbi:MAG: metallophosphoesterase, partial [Pseudomonadota bacterium]
MRRTLALLEHYGRRFSEQVMDFAYRQFDTASSKWKSLRSGVASGPAKPEVRREIPESQIPEGERVYAFGDIHGRADLLERLFDSVEADIEAFGGGEKVRLVFLGDYVDRGFQSKEVIDFLLSDRVAQYAPIFLKGNHEEAFLKFLSEPGFRPRWAGYGGA